jgi:integrase/recombinase XerD
MLTLYRRHRKRCLHRIELRRYRRCGCPVWVDGSLAGQEIHKSLDTNNWQRAQDKVRYWEAEGRIVEEEETEPLSFATAFDIFIADCKARGLREASIYKYRLLFKHLRVFAERHGRRYIKESDLDWLRSFRATWPNASLSASKKLACLKSFFRFAHESGWIATNPTLNIKPPKVIERQVMPFTDEEISRIVAACDQYPDRKNAVRVRALVLLLRHSGLRIRDAVTLSQDRISRDKLFLYTGKSGTPVWCPLPPSVLAALNAIPAKGNHFFWTGNSKPKSAVGNWQRALKRVFNLAEVPTGHSHRFRHSLVVSLLQAGVPLERIAALLGHRSVKVTEKYYSAWSRSRQDQLEADIRRTWNEPPTETKGTPEVHERPRYVN